MSGPILTTTTPKPRVLDLKNLVGSGHRIALLALPLAGVVFAVHLVDPTRLAIDASPLMRALAGLGLVVGVVIWAWSVALILTKVPKGELITDGPYVLMRHPLYTSVGLLVLPSLGILLGTWIGPMIGVAVYVASRLFAPEEEARLRRSFGPAWESYSASVKLPWL